MKSIKYGVIILTAGTIHVAAFGAFPQPIGVAAYRIVSELPKQLRRQLPSPSKIAKAIEDL